MTHVAALNDSRVGEYRAPFSVLDMLPYLRDAANDYIAFKKANRQQRRRKLTSTDDFTDISGDSDNDDEEEIIDPSEMPDEWGDDGDGFYDPIKDESSECVGVLMDITNNFMSYNNTVMHIFRNSGKDYNDFGRYEDCNEIHHFNYFMITVLKKFPIPFTMGLCLPQECQMEDLQEFKPFVTKAINAALPNMFEGVKGYAEVAAVEESDVEFVDPKIENKKVTQLDIVSVIICCIISFFVLMVVIATFLMWSYERDASKLQRIRSDRANSGFN